MYWLSRTPGALTWLIMWEFLRDVPYCSGLIARQEPNPTCTDGAYTTPIGLQFNVHCDYNAPGHDIGTAKADNITDCMEQCSILNPGEGFGPCQAVTLNITTFTCFFKDGNITTQNLIAAPGRLSALASASQFTTALDFTCPSDLQTTDNGMTFKIDCNSRHPGDPFVWDNDPYYQPHHSETIEECMEWCSNGSPLCYGVVWEADTLRGYRNCWPKNKNISSDLVATNLNSHTAHVLLSIDLSPCETGPYTTAENRTFQKSCASTMDGPFIDQVHTDAFDACIDYCERFTNGTERCTVAIYEPTAADGFKNCYLKTTTASAHSDALYNVAILNQPETTSSPNTTISDDSAANTKDGGSKAWIAGAVIGPLAGIALAVGVVLWWRGRQHKGQAGVHEVSASSNAVLPAEKSAETVHDRGELSAGRYGQGTGKTAQELP